MKKLFLTILLFLFALVLSTAQIDSLQVIKVIAKPVIDIENPDPVGFYGISSNSFSDSGNAKQQLSLDEYLTNIPGLFVLNRNNFSQDLRISIRGFGARSSFGIRGIKIVVDGIPETTPDGQGQIDNLSLGIIDKLQVVRSPASLVYGNAAGGIINIQTIQEADSVYTQASLTGGSYKMLKYDIIAGLPHKGGSTILSASRTTTDGYRDYSGFETNQVNLRSRFDLDNSSRLHIQLNYTDSPFALDAGGLTFDEARENKRQARDRNIQFESQEQVRQFKTGVSYAKQWEQLALNSYAFYSYRDFDNKLPFVNGGQVELYRNYYGNGSYLTIENAGENVTNKLQLGYALAFQADQRQRFDNLNGTRGSSDFNQLESFNSYGFYVIDQLTVKQWNFQGGVRYDINQLKAEDRTSAANSSDRNLNSWSGSLGVNYNLKDGKYIYSNISTSFETPALTELSSNPNGGTGFNPDLKPQHAINYEIGYQHSQSKLQWNAAIFYIKTTDDLVPFELAAFPDRDLFRNAGSTNRYGLELYANYNLSKRFSFQSSYTYSNFTYNDFEVNQVDLAGNELPGIPQHLATLGVTYHSINGMFLQWNTNYRGSLFVDDQNTTQIDDALISDINFSYPIKLPNLRFSINGGVNNIFDTNYFDNVRINAFGARYYEPAPGINFYVGMKVRI